MDCTVRFHVRNYIAGYLHTKAKLVQKIVYLGNRKKFCFAIGDRYDNDEFKNNFITRKLVILKRFLCGTQGKQQPSVMFRSFLTLSLYNSMKGLFIKFEFLSCSETIIHC